MKLTQFVNLLTIGLALSLTACGCKKTPQQVTPLPNRGPALVGDPDKSGQLGGGETGTGNPTALPDPSTNPYTGPEDAKIFEAYTVQFAYDSPTVRSSEKSKVAAVADYLRSHADNGLRVEGHCDERGTDQYNFTLGERRALAVREELIHLGIDGNRIYTVSFGRSRPIDTGHSDASHARNRRGAMVLLSK